MQAVAIFATPGAMAAAARRGLSAEQRAFCAEWFAANRDLATRLGYRVGTEALFAELEKDPGPFRARYGAAPKFAPSSRIWAREKTDVGFHGVPPIELIEQARHALIDLSLHAHLVSLPKNRDAFLRLGAWEGAELLHGEFVDVGQGLTKAFLAEASDAAEVQVYAGHQPVGDDGGLGDLAVGRWRGAPGATVSRHGRAGRGDQDDPSAVGFRLERRAAAPHRAGFSGVAGSGDSFDALLARRRLRFAARRALRPAAGGDQCRRAGRRQADLAGRRRLLVGSFDSARSVLERRLNLKAFPDLESKPGRPAVGAGGEGGRQGPDC